VQAVSSGVEFRGRYSSSSTRRKKKERKKRKKTHKKTTRREEGSPSVVPVSQTRCTSQHHHPLYVRPHIGSTDTAGASQNNTCSSYTAASYPLDQLHLIRYRNSALGGLLLWFWYWFFFWVCFLFFGP
jgi:hypothetical protein